MIFKEPIMDDEALDNLIVGHYYGKAIIQDEMGRLYYLECTEKAAPIGICATGNEMHPISELDESERTEIEDFYS